MVESSDIWHKTSNFKYRSNFFKNFQDNFGNKYYQSKNGKRWIIYKDEVDASKIPNEWYSWIHFTKNKIENLHELRKFNWQKPHQPNLTGTKKGYHPKQNKNAVKKKYNTWKN